MFLYHGATVTETIWKKGQGEAVIFKNRTEAGAQLARALEKYSDSTALVLALPRGGVVVGYEVARALNLPLDVAITRKLGAPGNPEYAIGAISETGDVQLNDEEIAHFGIPASYINAEIADQQQEIRRRQVLYRDGAGPPDVTGKTVLVVDDGIATGFTILATIRAIRKQGPHSLIIAVPVAPPSTVRALAKEADHVVALATPEPFMAVGAWYRDFEQVSDAQVQSLLRQAKGEGA